MVRRVKSIDYKMLPRNRNNCMAYIIEGPRIVQWENKLLVDRLWWTCDSKNDSMVQQNNGILRRNLINKFYVYKFYVETLLIPSSLYKRLVTFCLSSFSERVLFCVYVIDLEN